MEDRITPGLYLEMTSIPPDGYATERVPEVLGLPAVLRATWWENVHPGRTDFPRKLPEFRLLGVYEVFEEVKGRPRYVVAQLINFDESAMPPVSSPVSAPHAAAKLPSP